LAPLLPEYDEKGRPWPAGATAEGVQVGLLLCADAVGATRSRSAMARNNVLRICQLRAAIDPNPLES